MNRRVWLTGSMVLLAILVVASLAISGFNPITGGTLKTGTLTSGKACTWDGTAGLACTSDVNSHTFSDSLALGTATSGTDVIVGGTGALLSAIKTYTNFTGDAYYFPYSFLTSIEPSASTAGGVTNFDVLTSIPSTNTRNLDTVMGSVFTTSQFGSGSISYLTGLSTATSTYGGTTSWLTGAGVAAATMADNNNVAVTNMNGLSVSALSQAIHIAKNKQSTVTNARGVDVIIGSTSSDGGRAYLTNGYGIFIEHPYHDGNFTNNTGLYIDDQAVGTGDNYAIYTVGTARSVFGGNVGIGTSTFGTSSDKVVCLGSGTAPTTSPANAAQAWVGDWNSQAGQAVLRIRDENGTTGAIFPSGFHPVITTSDNMTLTADQSKGTRIYESGAKAITMAAVSALIPANAVSMPCYYVRNTGAGEMKVRPNIADRLKLPAGTALTDGIGMKCTGITCWAELCVDSADGWTTWGNGGTWATE